MKTLEQLAREAGLENDGENWFSPGGEQIDVSTKDLARFRALCMEEAAQIADAKANQIWNDTRSEAWSDEFELLAAAIRESIKD